MKKKIYKSNTDNTNAVMFNGKKYTVVSRSMTSVRIRNAQEEIIVLASNTQPVEDTAQEQEAEPDA